MNWTGWGYKRRRRRRKWNSSKTKEAIYEAKNFGLDYLTQKYGQNRVDQIVKKIEAATKTPGRGKGDSKYTNAGGDGPGKRRYVRGRGYVKVGSSSWNRPRKVGGPSDALQGLKVGGRFGDGGPPLTVPPPVGTENPFPPGTFQRRTKLNLENDSELAQGSHHEWAQATSLSSTITSLLRQAQNSGDEFADAWAVGKGGQYATDARDSSVFGMDLRWDPRSPGGTTEQAAMSNPMGAFGTQAAFTGFPSQLPAEGDEDDIPLPPQNTVGERNPIPEHSTPTMGPNANPWAYGAGGEANAYGPSGATMGAATMEAMALANAYFAPQRMELAYELGDMETDMRRLAVNLGRQVDDPVLQAKLYKEGMRAVRTLDMQQNTFAFQMVEQRRKEELQNFQFYDQLAQEEYRLYLQNLHFYEDLDLRSAYFNLDRYNVAHPPTPPTPNVGGTPPAPSPSPAMIPGGGGAYQGMSLGGALQGLNPYTSSGGGALVKRSKYPY